MPPPAQRVCRSPRTARNADRFEKWLLYRRQKEACRMRAVNLPRIPVRQNSFFDHLNSDVRHMIYDYLALPPFHNSTDSMGLYLSCRQAMWEMSGVAPTQMRLHHLAVQRKHMWLKLPINVIKAPMPVDTEFSIHFRIRLPNPQSTPYFHVLSPVVKFARDIAFLRLKRIRCHLVENKWTTLGLHTRLAQNYVVSRAIQHALVYPSKYTGPQTPPRSLLRFRVLLLYWTSSADSKQPLGVMLGHKYEISNNGADRPQSFQFLRGDNAAGALVVLVPKPFESGGMITKEEWSI